MNENIEVELNTVDDFEIEINDFIKVEVPSEYILPIANNNVLGGVKGNNKGTKDTVPVKIDGNGFMYVPTYPTTTSQLTNDSEYITNEDLPTKTSDLQNDSDYITNESLPTNTSELINDSNFAVTNENNNFSTSQTITGDLTITGNITQNGDNYETHAQKVYTTNDYIITREGATGGLANGEYTGFQAKLYDGTNDGRLVFDNTGTARIGDIGDEQPLLTRDENNLINDGQVFIWDSTKLKAKGKTLADIATSGSYDDLGDKPVIPTTTSQLTNDSNLVQGNANANNIVSNIFIGTQAEYDSLPNKTGILAIIEE